MTSRYRLAVGFELPDVFRNPYLMEQPDRVDPAVDSTEFAGWVLEPLLKQGKVVPLRLVSRVVGSFARGARARRWLRKCDGPSRSGEDSAPGSGHVGFRRGRAPAGCGRCGGLQGGRATCQRALSR